MGLWSNARRWYRDRHLRAALRAVRRHGLASPIREMPLDRGQILSYQALQAARQESQKRAIASQVDVYQERVPQYPVIGSSQALHRQGFRKNSVVRRCQELICESATQARLVVEDASGAEATSPVAASIRSLLEQPTGVYTGVGPERTVGPLLGADLMWRLYQDLYGAGNALWEWFPGLGTEEPVQIWRMDPARVAIVPSSEAMIGVYLYRLGGQWYEIPPHRVIHWRIWDPIDEFFGVPPLYSALRVLAADNELIDFFKVTLQNFGVPPIALEYDPVEIEKAGLSLIPDNEQLKEIRDKFWQNYGGANRGKPATTWGYKIRVIGLDMQKLGIGDLIATTEQRISMVYGVPTILIGRSGTQGDPTRANFREAREQFFTTVIASLVGRVGNVLSARLLPTYGAQAAGLRIRLDLSQVDVLREARLRRAGEAAKVFLSGLAARHECQDLAGMRRHLPNVGYRSDNQALAIEAGATEEPATIEELLREGAG